MTIQGAAPTVAGDRPVLLPTVLSVALVAAFSLAGLVSRSPAEANGPGPAALGSQPLVERTPQQFDADLRALRGRVVVVNFWASWCVPCRQEMPLLERVAAEYAGRGVTVVGVDTNDLREDARAFLARNQIGFPTVLDPKGLHGGIATRWSVTGLPQTWFVAPDGSRSSRFAGPIGEAELRRRVEGLLGAPTSAATP